MVEVTRRGEPGEIPRFAVWGGRMNLQGRWSHSKSRASGFLTTEACTPRGVAAHFVIKHRLKRRSKTITHKAGKRIVSPNALLVDRSWCARCRARRRPAVRSAAARVLQVAFGIHGIAVARGTSSSQMFSAAMTATRVGSLLASSRAAACIFASRYSASFDDVLRLEIAPNGVALAVNVDVDDAVAMTRRLRGSACRSARSSARRGCG